MTIRYLDLGDSVPLVNGVGSLSITPPSGQYWIPRIIRVGCTVSTALPFPNNQPSLTAALFHGGFQDTGVDAYVDGTGNGLGDVTSRMNGTLVQTAEYLTVAWQPLDLVNQAFPSSSGYLQIIGLTADTISEATVALATATPGPGFAAPIPNPMQMPSAGHVSSTFIFQNPGPSNTVTLINPSTGKYLYLYNVQTLVSAITANLTGYLQPVNGIAGDTFSFYDAASASLNTTVVWNYNGMRMNPNGLQWFQQGSAPLGVASVVVNTTQRFMPF